MTIEKVSQEEMLGQFRERLEKILSDNQKLATQIKENEVQALKLQGAIETLEYYKEEETVSSPPDEEVEE
jgi:hypothetical protein